LTIIKELKMKQQPRRYLNHTNGLVIVKACGAIMLGDC